MTDKGFDTKALVIRDIIDEAKLIIGPS